jgi:hypothetical protein
LSSDDAERGAAVRLEPLCEFDLSYTTEFLLVQPFGTEEGEAYGEGEGTVSGRINGRVRWVNHPHRRSDAVMLPNTDGMIETEDGARVLFTLQGRTPTEGPNSGQQLLRVQFTADEQYDWLNLVFAVAEGKVDFERMAALIRVFECVHDYT